MPGHKSFFVPAVRENLLCRICHLPVRNAVQVSVCGHRFCDSCLNHALGETRLRCPVDNTAIDYSQVYADDVTNQMIMSLTVICDYYQAGCKWKGQLRKLQGHLAECKFVSADCSNSCGARIQKRRMSEHTSKDCPKRRVCCARCKAEMSYEQLRVSLRYRNEGALVSDHVTCPRNCGERMRVQDKARHMREDCLNRWVFCQYCNTEIVFRDRQTHHQSCPSFPLSCPNNCGVAQIPRGEVELHLSRDCRSNIMQCPFRHVGCHKQFPQRSLQRHIEESVQQHLELVSELAIQQQKEINSLKEIVRHCKPYHDSKLLWRIDDFWEAFDEGKRKPGTELHSPVFYTSNYGYKFKVVLFPYGNGSGEGTHLSLYIRLLPGEYDSLLPWPFEGQITLTLLDQSTDKRAKRHISQSFSPDPNWKSFQRPSKNSTSLGFGYPQFVSHRGLESIGYVRDDVLFLKVTIDCKNAVDL
ncbi:predicted protein [Nematostella vectensis]|uniref:TNF receptor-associated factor n=1 Tax=Nematostella vectensis TaxID=45351 RepID=A7SER6_NEMVE|nr:predicted protein [Nematostella vectensis]|eukprot:XP_001629813.1 predicted protein [Nematostella vectensis]